MSDRKNNFILQAGILAAAGFITRIIGLIYVIPVTAIIGTVGLGYYQSAYNYYTIILLISSYSIPSAISKVIAQKLSLEEYRNAHRIFLCAMYYVLGVGLIASLLLYFGAGLFVDDAAVPVLKVFAPTIFLFGILGVLRGYFQAHRSMIQTSVSQILEQILNAIVSISAAYGFIVLFIGSFQESLQPEMESSRGVYGAMGSALGTGIGVVTALLFMTGIYFLNRKMILKRVKRDKTEEVDSYKKISLMIIQVVLPFILSTAVYNLNAALNTKLYTSIMINFRNMEEVAVYRNYGINSQAVKVANIPIAFASAMAAAIIPTIAQYITKKDFQNAREKTAQAIHTIMVVSIPSAVGLCVLANPVITLLFGRGETTSLAAKSLMGLSISIIFYALSTLSSSILQGIGKVNTPIINAIIALVLQTLVLVPLLMFTETNIFALVIASIVYSATMCILNQIAIKKALDYRQEIRKTFIVPIVAATFMGSIAWAVYEGIYLIIESTLIACIPAILIAMFLYFVLLVKLKGVSKEWLLSMPKGTILVNVAKKIKIL